MGAYLREGGAFRRGAYYFFLSVDYFLDATNTDNRVLKCDVTKYLFLGSHKSYCKF